MYFTFRIDMSALQDQKLRYVNPPLSRCVVQRYVQAALKVDVFSNHRLRDEDAYNIVMATGRSKVKARTRCEV